MKTDYFSYSPLPLVWVREGLGACFLRGLPEAPEGEGRGGPARGPGACEMSWRAEGQRGVCRRVGPRSDRTCAGRRARGNRLCLARRTAAWRAAQRRGREAQAPPPGSSATPCGQRPVILMRCASAVTQVSILCSLGLHCAETLGKTPHGSCHRGAWSLVGGRRESPRCAWHGADQEEVGTGARVLSGLLRLGSVCHASRWLWQGPSSLLSPESLCALGTVGGS